MPITVDHRAPAATVAGAAYTAGLGDYRRWQADQQFKRQALAQQDVQQQRSIAASLFGQRQNLQAQLARDFAQQRFAAQRDQAGQAFQLQRDQMQDAAAAARLDDEQAARAGLAQQAGAMNAAQEERLWSGSIMDAMQKAQKEGYVVNQLEYDKAYGEYQRIQKDSSLSPQERWLASGEARRRIEDVIQTAKPSPEGPPLSKEQRLDEHRAAVPVNPSDPEAGSAIYMQQPSRSGQPPTWKFDHFEFPDGAISKNGIHPQAAAREKLIASLATTQIEGAPDADGQTSKRFLKPEEIMERLQIIEAATSGKPIAQPPPPPQLQMPVEPPPPAWQTPTSPVQGGPPVPPPPVIENDDHLLQLLQENPNGLVVIDPRDNKPKFISPAMIKNVAP